MEMKMKNAVVYARYSSDRQQEESIEGQIRVCQDYAEQLPILTNPVRIENSSCESTNGGIL